MATKVLALGDSWFHYPRGLDKDGNPLFFFKLRRWLGLIGDKGNGNIIYYLVYRNKLKLRFTETTADQLWDATRSPTVSQDDVLGQCGEELMVMVHGYKRSTPTVIENGHEGGTWLDTLVQRVRDYASTNNSFIILLSGGGNDIADQNLSDFLNNAGNPDGPVNQVAFDKAIDQLKGAYQTIFERLTIRFPEKKFHFVLHGYGYPPVNGRGVFTALENSPIKFLQRLSPGPWLKSYFVQKGITDRDMQEQIIGSFIDKFNDMLQSLTAPANTTLHYVDLRPVTDKTDRNPGWCNELHFDHVSYVKGADHIYKIIQPLL